MSDPVFTGGSLKGLLGGSKKTKKSKKSKSSSKKREHPSSDDETNDQKEKKSSKQRLEADEDKEGDDDGYTKEEEDDRYSDLTDAERKALENRKKKELRDLEAVAAMSHRERIEAFNEGLGKLTELNDLPRISAAGNG
jgi:protein FAM32A